MVIIIGAGLSGLLTGYRLKNAGVPVKILEARDRIGGRIFTLDGTGDTPVEMGATWFGSQHINLIQLLKELDISGFEQYMKGTAYFQALSTAPVEAMEIPAQQPSYRIAGGSSALIRQLASIFTSEELVIGEEVKQIEFVDGGVRVKANSVFEGDKVVLALPPKLWIDNVDFQPEIPKEVAEIAKTTQTWMEESIKLALIYREPFWRNKKVSGTLFSNVGPITEFYDHSNFEESKYALCGFVHSGYAGLSPSKRKQGVSKQVVSIFGAEAGEYIDYQELVWSGEKHTSNSSMTPLFPHQNNGHQIFQESLFNGRLYCSNTETSPLFGGYMEGAVYAASVTAAKIIKEIESNRSSI